MSDPAILKTLPKIPKSDLGYMCQFPNIEQAYVVSMPNHNPDRQGPIITGSDINIAGKGKFYFDLFYISWNPNPFEPTQAILTDRLVRELAQRCGNKFAAIISNKIFSP